MKNFVSRLINFFASETIFWHILMPSITCIVLCLLFYCSLLYHCYPYQGSSCEIEKIITQYPDKFRDIPKEFLDFPTIGKVNWNYDVLFFNSRNVYGYYDLSRAELWFAKNQYIFDDVLVRDDESLNDYYELMSKDTFRTPEYFNLPHSEDKFVKIAFVSTDGRLKVYLYISRNMFLIHFG